MLFLVLLTVFSCAHATDVNEELRKAGIVPDVLRILPENTENLKIVYNDGSQVNFGNELTPTQVSNRPSVSWTSRDNETLHTLVMTDPDAPSRSNPTFREWKHWVVVNIPNNDVSKGDILADYRPAAPPPNTGLHRYVFLLYKQKSRIVVKNAVSSSEIEGRPSFRVSSFANEHSLTGPISANFYQVVFTGRVDIFSNFTSSKRKHFTVNIKYSISD